MKNPSSDGAPVILEPSNRCSPTPPAWFERAVAIQPAVGTVVHEGTRLRTLTWGDRRLPGLVLVHGGAAHAEWWNFLAPLFLPRFSAVALDLSGHGDSDRRLSYSVREWACELMAVVAAARFAAPPIVVGHSMGGLVTIAAASLFGDQLAGAIIVDSPVRAPDPESEEGQRGRAFRNPKTYSSWEEALPRFRLVPEQPCDNKYLLEYIARRSLHETPAGLTWKFDPAVFTARAREPLRDYLASVRCRIALLRGEHSLVVPPETGEYMFELLGRSAPLVEIPDAHHHLLLDQPLAFVAAVRALLADWEHSLPRRPDGRNRLG